MAMVAQRQRRTRECTGPSPCSVAIKARPPNTRPPEYRILERRKKEEKLNEAQAQTNYQKFCDLKNNWERVTDRKIQQNTVRTRVQGLLQAEKFNIEDRRVRLRDMLHNEEENYLREMEEKEETTLERQAKMRDRAKQLKEKRETERLLFVQDKYDQQFRSQCEELRSTMSKRQQDEVCLERMEQLRIKDVSEKQQELEEHMYAALWQQDIDQKSAAEERKAREKHERNRGVLETLRLQMAALEQKKSERQSLKQEEALLLQEQARLRMVEEQRAAEEKHRLQEETRDTLDLSLKLKMRKKAKEEQEQLAFEMKILQKLLEDSRNEAMEQIQRKKELREEDCRYRQYLHQMIEQERIKEHALEQLIHQEVENMWQKRLHQWQLEREARKTLLHEVLRVRKGQLADRLKVNELKQIESQKVREEIMRVIENNKKLEMEQKVEWRERNLEYQNDLDRQIMFNQDLHEADRERDEAEYQKGLLSEMEYQKKLQAALERPYSMKQHPMRQAVLNQIQSAH